MKNIRLEVTQKVTHNSNEKYGLLEGTPDPTFLDRIKQYRVKMHEANISSLPSGENPLTNLIKGIFLPIELKEMRTGAPPIPGSENISGWGICMKSAPHYLPDQALKCMSIRPDYSVSEKGSDFTLSVPLGSYHTNFRNQIIEETTQTFCLEGCLDHTIYVGGGKSDILRVILHQGNPHRAFCFGKSNLLDQINKALKHPRTKKTTLTTKNSHCRVALTKSLSNYSVAQEIDVKTLDEHRMQANMRTNNECTYVLRVERHGSENVKETLYDVGKNGIVICIQLNFKKIPEGSYSTKIVSAVAYKLPFTATQSRFGPLKLFPNKSVAVLTTTEPNNTVFLTVFNKHLDEPVTVQLPVNNPRNYLKMRCCKPRSGIEVILIMQRTSIQPVAFFSSSPTSTPSLQLLPSVFVSGHLWSLSCFSATRYTEQKRSTWIGTGANGSDGNDIAIWAFYVKFA